MWDGRGGVLGGCLGCGVWVLVLVDWLWCGVGIIWFLGLSCAWVWVCVVEGLSFGVLGLGLLWLLFSL